MGTGTLIVFLYAGCCLGITVVGIVAAVMIAMGRNERRAGRSTVVFDRDREGAEDDRNPPNSGPAAE